MALPLQVDEMGERCRYRVHSQSNPAKLYLVDLLANGGIGECSCRDWITRRWPLMKLTGFVNVHEVRCKHVNAARNHFLNQLLARMAQNETEPTKR